MGIEWSEAPAEVIRLATQLIEEHHPDLAEASVAFVMRSKRGKFLGKFVLGKASKVPDRLKPYIDFDFLIWLSEEDWKELDPETKRALIDHELCHCTMQNGKPKMRAHDIEEFYCIAHRYGLWHPQLKLFGEAISAGQGHLPGMEKSGRVGTITPLADHQAAADVNTFLSSKDQEDDEETE
jgi:hypothetical protein